MTLPPELDALREKPASSWMGSFSTFDRASLLRAAIAAIRELLLPQWELGQAGDLRPLRALQAAERCLAKPSENASLHALAVAKACTQARADAFGYDHRIAEAARAVACAAARPAQKGDALGEAFERIEEDLVARLHVDGEYGREPEVRRTILEIVHRHAVLAG